jgi:hypothetical protein
MLVMSARYGREDDLMARYRRFALGAVAWVVVVSAGAALVWTVISQAGADVAGELPATETQSQASSAPPASPTRSAGTGAASPAPPGPAKPVRRTWQGSAGVVVSECRKSAIDFVSAQPASGWSIEVDHTGPVDLRVEFEAGEAKTRVEAVCVGGVPSYTVEDD